jgi:ParB-like chromosome segregation protein Spo0J
MLVTSWAIDRVIPYDRNPRNNEAAVAKVAASLREFGWRQPIVVDAKGIIIAGHTRLLAARSLEMAEVPVHVADTLTPDQVRAYRLADNRIGQEAEWDDELLVQELLALRLADVDLGITGFDEAELEELLAEHTEQDEPDLTAEQFRVMVTCIDAREQQELFDELNGQGYNVAKVK